jgi:hypothetical protein
VLMRAQHRSWAPGVELATAAARWRPHGGGVGVSSAEEAREKEEPRWER